jgi:hypothetical protein
VSSMYRQESNLNEEGRHIMHPTLEYFIRHRKLALDETTIMPIVINRFTREDFASMLGKLHFNLGAELGTAEGIYSESLLTRNPDLTLYSIDPYASSEKNKWSPAKIKGYEDRAEIRLSPYSRCRRMKMFSHDASSFFSDNHLDFVYVDGNHHYEYALEDMRDWWRILKVGGIMAGHDWEDYPFPHSKYWNVKGAVNTFVEEKNIKPWFVFGRHSRIKEYVRCPRSWMWIKEAE